ncbi:MAG: protein-glutamate O-methyltransferase CheR [Dehalococcoidales bacterium]|nr:protein-glutamate O-methyltransferase CheR [Dehalococcoidales bacterium]
MNAEEFNYVKKKIRELTQFDLDNYGHNQMIRRLDGYIARFKVRNVVQYCKLIERDKHELEKLKKFLTINVSEFFRDAVQFRLLQDEILPSLLKKNLGLNIWSAGCSNGAEAYSVAILLDRLSPYRKHRVLATDIDKAILNQAATGGPYGAAEVRNVPPALLEKYFIKNDGNFRVIDRICNKVTFGLHDLTQDRFENHFDLIICRNTVIYFSSETKKILRKKFLDSLKVNGILFIGATETMLDARDNGFQRLSACFYRKKSGVPEKSQEPVVSSGSTK